MKYNCDCASQCKLASPFFLLYFVYIYFIAMYEITDSSKASTSWLTHDFGTNKENIGEKEKIK